MNNYLNWLPKELLEIIFNQLDRKDMKNINRIKSDYAPHVRKQIVCSFNNDKNTKELASIYFKQFATLMHKRILHYGRLYTNKVNYYFGLYAYDKNHEKLFRRLGKDIVVNMNLYLSNEKNRKGYYYKLLKIINLVDTRYKQSRFAQILLLKNIPICFNCLEEIQYDFCPVSGGRERLARSNSLSKICNTCFNDPYIYNQLY